MPFIDLSILNQRQTPAFYADVFANRPAAGFVGRIFISTNTFAFYRDNGTSWDLIGGPGTGTVTGTGANGQVTFWNGASTITGSNDLFWDATNGHLGVNTNAPGTALDVHHDQNTVAILNQTTATNDVRIGFQNNGVGLWRIGAFYNAGANDFGIFDAVGNIQPLTIKKTTGQVLIGPATAGAGKLVVSSTSSDNGVQIVGATAPSLRIDNAGTGATKRVGLGISTAVNNFIQGSVDQDFCIFNSSTTASPILFGVYDAGLTNTQEAARISAARNFLIGTTTDAGYKLDVNGTGRFTQSNGSQIRFLNYGGSSAKIQCSSGTFAIDGFLATTLEVNTTEVLRATSSGYIGIGTSAPATTLEVLGINEGEYFRGGGGTISGRSLTFSSFTVSGTVGVGHRISAPNASANLIFSVAGSDRLSITNSGAATFSTPGNTTGLTIRHFAGTNNPGLFITTTESNKYVTLTASGSSVAGQLLQLGAEGNSGTLNISASNVLIGTTTDAGYKLLVAGNARIEDTLSVSNGTSGQAIFTNNSTAVSVSTTTALGGSFSIGGNGAFVIVYGASGSNVFIDTIIAANTGTPTVLSSTTVSGSPSARTYSTGSNRLQLAMASGTYDVRINILRQT
jgi:hypothetical protein